MSEKKHWSGWYAGTEADWRAIPYEERKAMAFQATGCEVAYPTWKAPADCVHTDCRVLRGELPAIAITNAVLRYEMCSGWLRFGLGTPAGRARMARIVRGVRAAAMRTGIWDPWEMPGGWCVMVGAAVSE
jgi:hypothetical protein